MFPDMNGHGHEPVHSLLGIQVRERRERLHLTMEKLAERARISRSSLHRLEHGHPTTPTPANAARVLAAVEITAHEAEALVVQSDWRDDLLMWMRRNGHPYEVVGAAPNANGHSTQAQRTNGEPALEFSLWRGREPRYVVTLEPLPGGNADEMIQLAEWIRASARELGLEAWRRD